MNTQKHLFQPRGTSLSCNCQFWMENQCEIKTGMAVILLHTNVKN